MSQSPPSPQVETASVASQESGTDGRVSELPALVESLLFVADEPVTVSRLAQALEVGTNDVEAALTDLHDAYTRRGIRIQRAGNRVQLVSAPEAAAYIEHFLGLEVHSRLSAAALEALTIVAYQQPITRAELEAVRGVNCDSVLRTLTGKGLAEEVGRLETVGRPIQYGTTFGFLQFFGLESLDQLPVLDLQDSSGIPEVDA